MNLSEFISRATQLHNKYYDYKNVNYVNMTVKVEVICKSHGSFLISPSNHLNKRGCKECGKERVRLSSSSNLDEFILKANIIHQNKYCYSLTEYINWKTYIKIVCDKHGVFKQIPNSHLNGSGCNKCYTENRVKRTIKVSNISNKLPKNITLVKLEGKTLHLHCDKHGDFASTKIQCKECSLELKSDKFIRDASEIHNNTYDYSLVKYSNSNTKVKIVCSKHDIFEQTPHHHKNGSGCAVCSYMKISESIRLTTGTFINKAIGKHGNVYDYSKVNYITTKIPVDIICRRHGVFKQTPESHLSGRGCYNCKEKNERKNINERKNRKPIVYDSVRFIEKCKERHKDNYSYMNTIYQGAKNNIIVICHIHGEFEINAHHHTNGSGCKKCSYVNRITPNDVLLERFNKIHKNKYTYTIEGLNKSKDKIKIICKKHGEFKQEVDIHLKGSGCPRCLNRIGEERIIEILQKYSIEYITQKTFKTCVYKKLLYFDFYIQTHNTIIEFDGEQHFRPVDFFGGQKNYNEQVIRDNIKDNWCYDNRIKLIRIPYNEYHNIEYIIREKILHNYDKLQT